MGSPFLSRYCFSHWWKTWQSLENRNGTNLGNWQTEPNWPISKTSSGVPMYHTISSFLIPDQHRSSFSIIPGPRYLFPCFKKNLSQWWLCGVSRGSLPWGLIVHHTLMAKPVLSRFLYGKIRISSQHIYQVLWTHILLFKLYQIDNRVGIQRTDAKF